MLSQTATLEPSGYAPTCLDATCPRWLPRREHRVITLLIAVALISMADLVMTLTYATSVGMMEVNPLARMVMAFNSPWLVVLWKALTAGFGITVLVLLRSRWTAELAAWICFAAMLMLLMHWIDFNTHIVLYTEEIANLSGSDAHCWVQMTAMTTP